MGQRTTTDYYKNFVRYYEFRESNEKYKAPTYIPQKIEEYIAKSCELSFGQDRCIKIVDIGTGNASWLKKISDFTNCSHKKHQKIKKIELSLVEPYLDEPESFIIECERIIESTGHQKFERLSKTEDKLHVRLDGIEIKITFCQYTLRDFLQNHKKDPHYHLVFATHALYEPFESLQDEIKEELKVKYGVDWLKKKVERKQRFNEKQKDLLKDLIKCCRNDGCIHILHASRASGEKQCRFYPEKYLDDAKGKALIEKFAYRFRDTHAEQLYSSLRALRNSNMRHVSVKLNCSKLIQNGQDERINQFASWYWRYNASNTPEVDDLEKDVLNKALKYSFQKNRKGDKTIPVIICEVTVYPGFRSISRIASSQHSILTSQENTLMPGGDSGDFEDNVNKIIKKFHHSLCDGYATFCNFKRLYPEEGNSAHIAVTHVGKTLREGIRKKYIDPAGMTIEPVSTLGRWAYILPLLWNLKGMKQEEQKQYPLYVNIADEDIKAVASPLVLVDSLERMKGSSDGREYELIATKSIRDSLVFNGEKKLADGDLLEKLSNDLLSYWKNIKKNNGEINPSVPRDKSDFLETLHSIYSKVSINKDKLESEYERYSTSMLNSPHLSEDEFGRFIGLRALLIEKSRVFIYYPHWSNRYETVTFSLFCAPLIRDHQELQTLFIALKAIGDAIDTLIARDIIHNAQTQSALATIMTRNFSHNIGSHVLAYVIDKINELNIQDNRILFEYIQTRNDFLAQSATDFPRWTCPAWLGQEIMANFYSQKHLLSFIANSEGWRARQYEDNSGKQVGAEDKNDGNETKVIDIALYFKEKEGVKSLIAGNSNGIINGRNSNTGGAGPPGDSFGLEFDQRIAIPGGFVGYHALYTILENIIRNAAKHNTKETIDLNIDIILQENDSPWYFDVIIVDGLTKKGKSQLVEELNEKLCGPIVSPSGTLEQKDWGMKEIKIAAAYLVGEDKFALSKREKIGTNQIIRADWKKNRNNDSCLGYIFKLQRPKELLIIAGRECTDCSEKIKELNRHGIDVVESYQDGKTGVDFELVLYIDNTNKLTSEIRKKLPCRLVVASDSVRQEDAQLLKNSICRIDRIPKLLKTILKDESLDSITGDNVTTIKAQLFTSWITSLAAGKNVEDQTEIQMYVNTKGSDPNGTKVGNSILGIISERVKNAETMCTKTLTSFFNKTVVEGKKISKWKLQGKMQAGFEKANLDKLRDDLKKKTGFDFFEYEPSTLPNMLRRTDTSGDIDNNNSAFELKVEGCNDGEIIRSSVFHQKNITVKDAIYYLRHHPVNKEGDTGGILYQEELTGAAQHANLLFRSLGEGWQRLRTILQMVENGILRIAIADERLLSHAKDHIDDFKAAGICCVKKVGEESLNVKNGITIDKEGNVDISGGICPHILILHKTIIEKNKWHLDDSAVDTFISGIQKQIPHIIITTGRGSHQHIPGTRFVPFSALKPYFMASHHSKFLATGVLLKALM